MVDIGGKKKRAMVYIMNQQRTPGRPSLTYIETIRQGYIDNNFDLTLLRIHWIEIPLNADKYCGIKKTFGP